MDNADDLLDLRAELRAELQQLGPFGRSDLDPLGKLFAKDPVLGLEVLDHLNQLILGGASQKQQQRVDESLHGSKMRKSLVELEVAYF